MNTSTSWELVLEEGHLVQPAPSIKPGTIQRNWLESKLLPTEGDFCSRHPYLCMAAVLVLSVLVTAI